MDLHMNGKTALVTGGSAGIGKAITFALAREGVDVAICARRKEPLEAAASQIARDTNRKIVPIPADLTKPADAEAFVQEAHTALGRIDILVNNAGSAPGTSTSPVRKHFRWWGSTGGGAAAGERPFQIDHKADLRHAG